MEETENSEYLLNGSGFYFGMMKVLWDYIEVMVAQHYEFLNAMSCSL